VIFNSLLRPNRIADQIESRIKFHESRSPALKCDLINDWATKFVHERFDERRPLYFLELEQLLADRWNLSFKPDTIRRFIRELLPNNRTAAGKPIDSRHVFASVKKTRQSYGNFSKCNEDSRREFVFSVTETRLCN
jgi:hypothetical protein